MLSEILKEKGYKLFRGAPFIDREEEIAFFKEYFKETPQRILFVYGPKSSGKTTLIEYVVENELFEDFENLKPKDNYWVKYVNLRGYLITSYNTFLDAFIKPKKEESRKEQKLSARMRLGIFEINREVLKEVKNKEKDLFNVLLQEIEERAKKNQRPILIIDEIQTLEEIYINGEKELLKEFLNFCVRLTKELHLSHVVILTSNTIFLNRIYNDSKLKETSDFKLIEHPRKEIAERLLNDLGYTREQIALITDYYGTIIARLLKLYTYVSPDDSMDKLKRFLEEEKLDARMQIDEILTRTKKYNLPANIFEEFKIVADEIVKNGCFDFKDKGLELKQKILPLIEVLCEKEILFFDPKTGIITPNSRIYLKAMESMVK